MQSEMQRRYIKPGELLAIRRDFVQADDRGAFFWLFAPPVPENEWIEGACVVRINGPLDYHDEGCGESYESIVKRVQCGIDGDEDHGPASSIVLRIDSPGGVVAGLDQTVRRLRSMSKDCGVPIYAYVDETAYSAGYALCCAASEVYLPASGFLGSIGVISTMVDMTAADRKAGYRFVVLTSGARKADGHPHVAITDAMIAEEVPRVETLARQFFATVKRARGVPVRTIQGWEAKRFLGSEATRAGLADGIMSWTAFTADIAELHGESPPVAQPGTRVPYSSATRKNEMLAIDALIARKEAAIKAEKDATKLVALYSELEAAKKTKKMTEEEESASKDEEEEEAASAKKTSKGDETDRNDDEDEDEEDDDEDGAKKGKKSSKKSSKKSAATPAPVTASDTADTRIAAIARELTGKSDASAVVAALQGMVAGAEAMQDRLASLELRQRKSDRAKMISDALAARRITPHEAKQFATKKLEFVEQVIAMRPAGSAVVDTEHPQFAPGAPPEAVVKHLPEAIQKQLKMAEAHAKAQGFKFDPVKVANEALAKMNGANGKAEV